MPTLTILRRFSLLIICKMSSITDPRALDIQVAKVVFKTSVEKISANFGWRVDYKAFSKDCNYSIVSESEFGTDTHCLKFFSTNLEHAMSISRLFTSFEIHMMKSEGTV